MKLINMCVLTFSICLFQSEGIAQSQIIFWDSLDNHIPSYIQYDTLEGVFLQELSIRGYADNDVLMKGAHNFVKQFPYFNKETYQNGYFILNQYYVAKIAQENLLNYYDSLSFNSVFQEIYKAYRENLIYLDNSFNPTYGCFYKKIHLKIEVIYLGNVVQRIPLFVKNEKEIKRYMRRNKGRDYEICALPTYLITRIFEWEVL